MPAPTLIFNPTIPNTVPLALLLAPSGTTISVPPGIDLVFEMLAADGTGNTTGGSSPLGTVALGGDGTSVAISPTTTGQFGYAILRATATPPARSSSGPVTATLFLLFLDSIDDLVYDTANIH